MVRIRKIITDTTLAFGPHGSVSALLYGDLKPRVSASSEISVPSYGFKSVS
jgi:hypothetical protein